VHHESEVQRLRNGNEEMRDFIRRKSIGILPTVDGSKGTQGCLVVDILLSALDRG